MIEVRGGSLLKVEFKKRAGEEVRSLELAVKARYSIITYRNRNSTDEQYCHERNTFIFVTVCISRTTSPIISCALVFRKLRRSLFAGTSGMVKRRSLELLGGGLMMTSSSKIYSTRTFSFFIARFFVWR